MELAFFRFQTSELTGAFPLLMTFEINNLFHFFNVTFFLLKEVCFGGCETVVRRYRRTQQCVDKTSLGIYGTSGVKKLTL